MSIAKPRACADIAVFRRTLDGDKVLLVTRGEDPFRGMLCLPGGLIQEFEQPIDAARRKVLSETGLPILEMTLAFAVSEPARDPRGWTVSCLYFCEDVFLEDKRMKPGDFEEAIGYYPCSDIHLIDNLVPGFHCLIGRLYEAWRRSL